jgi:hypothetical protein
MAISPRDIPITRDQVASWLEDWPAYKQDNPDHSIQDFIEAKVDELDLIDPNVDTSQMEMWDDQTHVADMIVADLPSYGYTGNS